MSAVHPVDVRDGALFARFDRAPALRWLGRFVSRRALRNLGPLRLYLCRRDAQGPEWPVLVGRAVAERAVARAALDRLAEAHARLVHPWVAQVAERAAAGELEFLVFAEPAACDLETLLAWCARRTVATLPHAAGEALALGLLGALEHAHARAQALGSLGASQVLVGDDGTCRLFGFGGLPPGERGDAPTSRAPDAAGDFSKHARDVCAWACFVRSQRRSFARAEPLGAALRREPLAPAFAWLGESVQALEHTLCEGRTPLSAEVARAVLAERHARLGIAHADGELRAALSARLAELARVGTAHASPGHGERYVLERPLGQGASSSVFKAWDRQLRQHVVVKRLAAQAGAESVARLLREVRTLRAVRHPQLVRGYELYEDRGQIGAVMEYVPGPTLRELVRQGALSAPEAREALAQVADALADLHRMGIAHRDVKPANVIVSPGRGAVLVDFGVVSAAQHEGSRSLTLTSPGAALGEPRYRAPELAQGASSASDVYALALVACETLAPGDATLSALSEPLRSCLRSALAADPRARPGASALSAALRHAPSESRVHALSVALDGTWLQTQCGERVDLTRRSTLRRLLAALAEACHHRPGRPLSRAALFEAGWPDERIDESSARNRVYVALAELRRIGLRGVLVSDGDGYRLDPRAVCCTAEPRLFAQ